VKIITDGKPERTVEIVRFQDRNIQYVTLLSDNPSLSGSDTESIITLPQEAYVYNVREEEFLGKCREIKSRILPARAQVFALSPYKIEGFSIETEPEYHQGDVVTFQIAVVSGTLTPNRHCIHIDVIDPDGNTLDYYGQNIFITGGGGEGTLRLALNEKAGEWIIQAKDVTSGLRDTAVFNVIRK